MRILREIVGCCALHREEFFAGGVHGVDQRGLEAIFFQRGDASDGGAASGADGVTQRSGMFAAFQHKGSSAVDALRGEGVGIFRRNAEFDGA